MKRVYAILLALCLMAMVGCQQSNAAEIRHAFTWAQPHGEETRLPVPMRGGLLLVDAKRGPDETQWLRFRIRVNDYFDTWRNDHIFVLLDGYFNFSPNPAVPYAARGIILDAKGMRTENFVDQSLSGLVPVAWRQGSVYEIIVHANATHVAGWVAEIVPAWGDLEVRRELGYLVQGIPDQTPAQRVSLIVIGALTDFTANPAGTRSRLDISRLEHGRFAVR
jgi:hypothetical protein